MVIRDLIILAAVSAALIFFNLGGGSLSSWDEAFYAEVSREMFESGDRVNLTWGDAPWNDKPPLYMWVTSFFYGIFGVNEFSARLFSAICGVSLVLLTYFFSLYLFDRMTAFLSGIMLASTYHFLWFAKMGTLDVAFTFFLFSSLYFFLVSEKNPVYLLHSSVFFAMAFMTKGIGALILPVTVFIYLAISGRWSLIFNRYTVLGVFLSLALILPWYVKAYGTNGMDLIEGHFFNHFIRRSVSAMDEHNGNILTYFNVILYKGKPWGTLGLIALVFFSFCSFKERAGKNILLICWILTSLSIFTFIKTKLHWYIIPVYPAISVIAAWGISTVLKKRAAITVLAVSLAAVIYFAAGKNLFALDFNNDIKTFAGDVMYAVSEDHKLYLYKIEDPGLRFYLGENDGYVRDANEFVKVYHGKSYIVTRKSLSVDIRGEVVLEDKNGEYVLIITTPTA